ncbi:MAG: hypothetical protein U0166_27255 [Acidobacteriota bacterium]
MRLPSVAVAIGVASAALAAEGARDPALGQLATGIAARLASELPSAFGSVTRVQGPRALTDLTGAAAGDVLDVYGPEPGEDEEVVSLLPIGRCRVVDAGPGGTWVEPLPPLLPDALAGATLRARTGPRRVALSCGPVSGPSARLAGALALLLPERLRARGFLAIDAPAPRASLFADKDAAESMIAARDLDQVLHVVVAVRGGEALAYGELVTAGKPPRWDVFEIRARADDQIALLFDELPDQGRGLRSSASAMLPSPPLSLAAVRGAAGSALLVLTRDALLRFRYQSRTLEPEATVPLPPVLPRAAARTRSPAGALEAVDLDRDGKTEVYLTANWLALPYRVVPLLPSGPNAGTGTMESVAEPVLAAAGGGYLTGAFLEGTDVLSPTVGYRAGPGQPPVSRELPFGVQRIVPWEGRHFLVLTVDGEIDVLSPEVWEVTPLMPSRRTGYAFDISYDAQNARKILASTSLATEGDQVTLQYILPEQAIARVDVAGIAEAVLLRDLDGDGKIELVVAEGPGTAREGQSRLSVYPTEMVANAPIDGAADGKAIP